MGLGLHGGGVGVAKFFVKQGANVLVTDLKTEEQLEESIKKLKGLKIDFVLGGHKQDNFINADLVIKNPDVPENSYFLKVARENNIPVETDVSLFFKLSKAFVIGVTGTKGKSTTASLIYHLLKARPKGYPERTFLAGNIGVSPLELLSDTKKGDKVVLELSSFELEGLTKSPNIAVITNIMPDHLNRYKSMTEYVEAKKIIFKFQKKSDYLILNNDDPASRGFAREAKSKVCYFSPKTADFKNFKLFGEHNKYNLAAAIAVAKLLKLSDFEIQKVIKIFKGVPSRQQFIREVNGVKYFNDTTATMPEAAITAIHVFLDNFPNSRLILICGGMDKGLKYDELATIIRERVDELIMLPGVASNKIKLAIRDYTKLHEVSSMQEAVKIAKKLAKRQDVVVLSPAATSFNLFRNEFDRGDQFVKAVKGLK